MKANSKGFTLIELLAVIVVLGIILAIAIPKVVDTIENSKKGSFESSVKSYIKSAQQYVAKKEVEGTVVTRGDITNLDMQNKNGWIGYWQSDNGKISFSAITNNDYVAYNATNDSINSTKLDKPFNVPEPVILTSGATGTIDGLRMQSDPNNSNILITSYDGINKNLIIPSGVTHIGGYYTNENEQYYKENNYIFDMKGLTNVVIPNSVTHIGYGAFTRNYLTKIAIPDSVVYIDGLTFAYNYFTTITIPKNVTTIDMSAFAYNNELTTIVNKTSRNFTWETILSDSVVSCTPSNTIPNGGNGFETGICTIGSQTITITK